MNELTFISERLRIEARGPAGERGPMGRDGYAGAPGPRGECGAKGEPGKAAPVITAWEPNGERFTITPVYTDGTRGVPANLLSLFQSYDEQVDAAEAADEADAARAERDKIDREVANLRAGLPAR